MNKVVEHPKDNTLKIAASIAVIYAVLVGAGFGVATMELNQSQAGPKGPPAASAQDYLALLYPNSTIAQDPKMWPVMFIWDTANTSAFRTQAPNLSLSWPPAVGDMYRLVAYPFPPKKYQNVFLNTIYGIFQLVNTYTDQYGFPGFFVNLYNPISWAINNPFMPAEAQNTLWTADSTCCTVRSGGPTFPLSQFQWVEVMHACYPLPNVGYPACDDGAYWIYAVRSSGIWWNTGNACIGLHKLERGTYLVALMLLWDCMAQFNIASPAGVQWSDMFVKPDGFTWNWIVPANSTPDMWKTWRVIAQNMWKTITPTDSEIDVVPAFAAALADVLTNKRKPSTPTVWQDYWNVAVDKNVKKAMDAKGERSVFSSVWNAIQNELHNKSISPDAILFFRFFKSTGTTRTYYYSLITQMTVFLASLSAALLTLVLAFFGIGSFWVPFVLFIIACAVAGYSWFWGLENMLEGLGWTTLNGALQKYSLDGVADVTDLWNAYCSPYNIYPYQQKTPVSTLDYKGGKFKPDSDLMQAFGGFGNNWLFDMVLVLFAVFLQFDSVIMTSQPNKSGTWTVEMMDVTHVRLSFDASCSTQSGSSLPVCFWQGGICGSNVCQFPGPKGECKGVPDFFDCSHTLFPFPELPTLSYKRGGLCRGFAVSSDPNVYATLDPNDTLRTSGPLTSCDCIENSSMNCLSCKGHISGSLCSPK
jgi:hypothetical protein